MFFNIHFFCRLLILSDLKNNGLIPTSLAFALPFKNGVDCIGFIGLGYKLIGEPYNKDDEELLDTLVNNLMIALKVKGRIFLYCLLILKGTQGSTQLARM